jgi:ABC-type polysaccharide/polyol phosphate export permease
LNHQIIILGKIPPLSDWLYTSTFVFSILFLGYGIFKKYEKRITEEL